MSLPKVLVGCPTSDHKRYCLKEYSQATKGLSYMNKEILLVDNSEAGEYANEIASQGLPVIKDVFSEKARDRVVHSRNILREKVLEGDFDYLLSLEQDVFADAGSIHQLIEDKKAIVGGIVMAGHTVHGQHMVMPMAWLPSRVDANKMRYITKEEIYSARLVELFACSLSCLLIHRSVLEKIKFRYESDTFDDVCFCEDARKAGFKIFLDTKVKPKHWPSGWEGIQ